MWLGMHVLLGMMLAAGCHSPADKYKPGPRVEQYAVPPEADARFSQPMSYPSNLLNKDNPRKMAAASADQPPPIRSPQSQRAMGGGSPGGF